MICIVFPAATMSPMVSNEHIVEAVGTGVPFVTPVGLDVVDTPLGGDEGEEVGSSDGRELGACDGLNVGV